MGIMDESEVLKGEQLTEANYITVKGITYVRSKENIVAYPMNSDEKPVLLQFHTRMESEEFFINLLLNQDYDHDHSYVAVISWEDFCLLREKKQKKN